MRYISISERIREAREMRGLTQLGLAKITRIKNSNICKYEKGERIPQLDNLVKLAKALRVSTDFLVGIREDMD